MDYMWQQLAYHLSQAGAPDGLEEVVTDLNWVTACLLRDGPVGPTIDLSLGTSARAVSLMRHLAQATLLLAPQERLPRAVVHILLCRLDDDAVWRDDVARLHAGLSEPYLTGRWPLPERPHPALRRIFTRPRVDSTYGESLSPLLAIGPDGTWLAVAGRDETAVQLWDERTGRMRASLIGHRHRIDTFAICADGTWIATADQAGHVRLWDTESGMLRSRLPGRPGSAIALTPDGESLATAGRRVARVFDVATGRRRSSAIHAAILTDGIALAADAAWAVVTTASHPVQLLNLAKDRTWAKLRGHSAPVYSVAISPDNTWLATASDDGTVRLWETADGRPRAQLDGHTRYTVIAIAPDSRWLVTATYDFGAYRQIPEPGR